VVATGCCSPQSTAPEGAAARRRLADMLREANVNDYAASVRVYAVKE